MKATPNLVSSKHRQGIKRRRNRFRRLTQAKTSIKAKRRILTQKGGSLLPFLVPLLGTIISGECDEETRNRANIFDSNVRYYRIL